MVFDKDAERLVCRVCHGLPSEAYRSASETDRLRHTGWSDQRQRPQPVHRHRYLLSERSSGHLWNVASNYLCLALFIGVVYPVVETPPLEGAVHLPGAFEVSTTKGGSSIWIVP